jgi:hypothetical protein
MPLDHRGTPHRIAWRASVAHIPEYLRITLCQLLLRALALSPLIYADLTKGFFGVPKAHTMGIAMLCCIPLYLLLVLPLRYRVGGRLSGWLKAEGPPSALSGYPAWLAQGLLIFLRALPWLLPLFAYFGAFYYYMNMTDFPSFFLMIRNVGGLVGGDYVHGVALLVLLLLVCAVLAAWGWYRVMPSFYLPLHSNFQKARKLKAIRRASHVRGTTMINLLLALPPLVIVLAVLASSLITRMTGDIQLDLMILLPALTAFDFPRTDLLMAGLAILLLYLPFVLYRKAALAAAIHKENNTL